MNTQDQYSFIDEIIEDYGMIGENGVSKGLRNIRLEQSKLKKLTAQLSKEQNT